MSQKQFFRFEQSWAEAFGLNESIFLGKLDAWLEHNQDNGHNFRDGHYWAYNTIQVWRDKYFTFWSKRTVERVISNLEEQGILICARYNKKGYDKTKWYRIDYQALSAKLTDSSIRQNDGIKTDKVAEPIPTETTTETTTENKAVTVATATRPVVSFKGIELFDPSPMINKEKGSLSKNQWLNSIIERFQETLTGSPYPYKSWGKADRQNAKLIHDKLAAMYPDDDRQYCREALKRAYNFLIKLKTDEWYAGKAFNARNFNRWWDDMGTDQIVDYELAGQIGQEKKRIQAGAAKTTSQDYLERITKGEKTEEEKRAHRERQRKALEG